MAKKKYRCMGYEITIDEAKELCCVSEAGIYARLKAAGGDMEDVIRYYDHKYGGVIDRMKKMLDGEREAEAVEEIMAAIGIAEDPEDSGESELDALDMVIPLTQNSGAMILLAEEETKSAATEKPAQQPEKAEMLQGNAVLCALNLAIKAIYALDKCMVGNSVLYDVLQNSAEDLESVRYDKFGHLVDWEAIASKLKH